MITLLTPTLLSTGNRKLGTVYIATGASPPQPHPFHPSTSAPPLPPLHLSPSPSTPPPQPLSFHPSTSAPPLPPLHLSPSSSSPPPQPHPSNPSSSAPPLSTHSPCRPRCHHCSCWLLLACTPGLGSTTDRLPAECSHRTCTGHMTHM